MKYWKLKFKIIFRITLMLWVSIGLERLNTECSYNEFFKSFAWMNRVFRCFMTIFSVSICVKQTDRFYFCVIEAYFVRVNQWNLQLGFSSRSSKFCKFMFRDGVETVWHLVWPLQTFLHNSCKCTDLYTW